MKLKLAFHYFISIGKKLKTRSRYELYDYQFLSANELFVVIVKFAPITMHKIAIFALIGFFSLSILFHLGVLLGVVPPNIIWGGLAQSKAQLIRLEVISLTVNFIFLFLALMLNKTFKFRLNPKAGKIILTIMGIIFLLNTLGNLLAKTNTETIIFTPVTTVLSFLCFYLAFSKD